MGTDPEFDQRLRNAILTLRRQVRFQDGRPYDARCSKVAAALEAQFSWPRRWGRLHLLDSRVCWQHCWNQLADGRILDATADQFESRWLGDIVVLEASDPHARAYQPAPPGWTFTLREQEAVIELDAVRDGAEVHDAAMLCTNWIAATRALRVRAFLRQSMTSGQLDDLLTMYEWAHAQASRGGPWMSSEYAAVLEERFHKGEAIGVQTHQQTNEGGCYGS